MLSPKKQIIHEIRKDLGSSTEEITGIVDSQLNYTAYVMRHSGFETIRWPYLGKFIVNPGRLFFLNKKRDGGI